MHVSAVLEEQLYTVGLAVLRCQKQSRIRVCTVLDKQLHGVRVAIL